MPVDWGNYEVFRPPVGSDGPLESMPRNVAFEFYTLLMKERGGRKAALTALLECNRVEELSLNSLDEWLHLAIHESSVATGTLAPRWYGVLLDAAVFLGDDVIARSGGTLYWKFWTSGGKQADGYQAPVIAGVRRGRETSWSIIRIVNAFGFRIAQGSARTGFLVDQAEKMLLTVSSG